MSFWIVVVDIEVLNTYTFEPNAGVVPGGGVVLGGVVTGGGVAPPLGSAHCWLEVSAHVQIWTWVPELP
jgi:hypothetical protein